MKTILLTLLSALALSAQAAEPLLVAAASDLTHSVDELGAAFAAEVPGAQVKFSTGASGNLFAQITNGAPFDVFLSADLAYPTRLAAAGAAERGTLVTYAIGRLAVWTVDPRFDLTNGMRVFNDARLSRVAIANPDVAPYGKAAKAALQSLGFWDGVKDKLVLGENIAQTAQFVQTGNAQVGIISYATVLAPKMKGVGRYYLVPDTGNAPLEQGAILTRHGKNNPLAPRFLQFLHSPAARAILLRHGFTLPHDKND
jgi:molybdate transport system substrate-binding protein